MKAEQPVIDPVKPISKKKTEKLVARDVILQKLLDVSARDKTSAIVSKHYFHEALVNDEPDEEEKKDDDTSSSSQLLVAIQSSTSHSASNNDSSEKKSLAVPATSGNGPAAVNSNSIQGKTLSPMPIISETPCNKPSSAQEPPSSSIQDLTRSPAISETPKQQQHVAAKIPSPKTTAAAPAKRELVMPVSSTKKRTRSNHDTTPTTGGEEPLDTKKQRSRSLVDGDRSSIPAPQKRKMTAAKTIVKKKTRKAAIQAKV